MKKRGNINIKLTNILKQTQDCCNKKKCPKGSKKCKPTKKRRKKEEVGIFGGMPNIRPTSRAIPMPQSIMNNITPVPNIPMPIQLPSYSQFRRPPSMYQRNDRPLQVQQGRGVRQPERQPLMVSAGIQTARQQAIARPRQAIAQRRINRLSQQLQPIAVQTATRGEGVVSTQAPKQLKFNPPPQPRPIPILDQALPKRIFTEIPPRPIPKLGQVPPPRLTLTRGVRSDREIRGSQGTADQPFNAPVPTPNILDIDSIRMRNEEQDRREVARALVQMREKRIEGTIEDIGQGTPRVDKEEEKDIEEQQIEGVKQLIEDSDESLNQGQTGFVADRISQIEPPSQVSDEPVRAVRRGRPRKEESEIIARRRQNLVDQGDLAKRTAMEILAMSPGDFDFSDDEQTAAVGFV